MQNAFTLVGKLLLDPQVVTKKHVSENVTIYDVLSSTSNVNVKRRYAKNSQYVIHITLSALLVLQGGAWIVQRIKRKKV